MMEQARRLACRFGDWLIAFNGNPLTVLLLGPVCSILIAVGWSFGQLQLFLLALTTVLSVDASLASRVTTLKMRKDSGEEPGG